jgi:choline dehydrogenase
MNYYDDPRDLKVVVAAIRRAMDIVAHWPGNRPPRAGHDSALLG